jgi:mRNA interferase HigB
MHLISIRNLRADVSKYPNAAKIVDRWYATVKQASWQNLEELRQDYPEAEAVSS